MKRSYTPAFALLILVAALGVSHSIGQGAAASSFSDTDLQHRLVGSWKVASFTDVPERGETVYPYGTMPDGLMTYTGNGYFSISVMAGPKALVSKDMSAMSVEALVHVFLSWFGTYRISNNQTIVFHVFGSSYPAHNGTEQIRTFRFERDTLVFYGDYAKNDRHYHYEHVFRRL